MSGMIFRIACLGIVLALWGTARGQVAPPAPAAAVAAPAADAKGYTVLPPYVDLTKKPIEISEQRAKENKAKGIVRQVLTGALPLADNKPGFDYFYSRMYFPNFTQTTDQALTDLPVERQRLLRDHLEACTVATVHAYLADKVFTQMQEFVQGNYHPACRYNAMLVICGLNDVEVARVGSTKATPEPMIRALPFIYGQYTKADNNDAIRVAALLGLVRHLEWDNFRGPADPPFTPAIAAPLRAEIVKALLDLAQQTEPPVGRDAAGHEWFRRRAIEGLTHASYYKVDAPIADAMDQLLKDEKESLAIRCAAATAIGKVVYQAPAKLETTPTAKELGYLALLACDRELTRVANLVKHEDELLMKLSGGGMGSGMGGMGSGMGGMDEGMLPGSMPGGSGSGRSAYGRPSRSSGSGSSGMMPRSAPGSGRSGSGMMPGMMPGMSGEGMEGMGLAQQPLDPKQYRFDLIRRRIRAQLYAVEIGLGGPDVNLRVAALPKPVDGAAPAATGPLRGVAAIAKGKPDEPYVTSVKAGVGKLVEAVETPDSDMATLEKELRKQMKPLEAITRKLAAAAPVEAPSDLPEAPLPTPAPAGRPADPAEATGPAAPAVGPKLVAPLPAAVVAP